MNQGTAPLPWNQVTREPADLAAGSVAPRTPGPAAPKPRMKFSYLSLSISIAARRRARVYLRIHTTAPASASVFSPPASQVSEPCRRPLPAALIPARAHIPQTAPCHSTDPFRTMSAYLVTWKAESQRPPSRPARGTQPRSPGAWRARGSPRSWRSRRPSRCARSWSCRCGTRNGACRPAPG